MSKVQVKKVVVAYSGGLDTSVIIPWLKENYDCEVIAFVADVGQGEHELEGIEAKAKASGASECYISRISKKRWWLTTSTQRLKRVRTTKVNTYLVHRWRVPIIAKAQVEVARKVGADALCHGCTGKGNDQVRFEGAFAALAPDLHVIAPWREWDLVSREECLDYLAERNIPCTASLTKIYSRDANAWHISTEGGVLEDTWNAPDDDCLGLDG